MSFSLFHALNPIKAYLSAEFSQVFFRLNCHLAFNKTKRTSGCVRIAYFGLMIAQLIEEDGWASRQTSKGF